MLFHWCALERGGRFIRGQARRNMEKDFRPLSVPRDTPPRLEPTGGGGISSLGPKENEPCPCPAHPGWSPTADPDRQGSRASSPDLGIHRGLAAFEPQLVLSLPSGMPFSSPPL